MKTILLLGVFLIPRFAHATDCDKTYPTDKFPRAHQVCLEAEADAAARKAASDQAAAELHAKCEALPADEKALVATNKLKIGMSEQALVCSWGEPRQGVHQSVGSWGVHKQYVYGDTYVYVENGRVTSWQN